MVVPHQTAHKHHVRGDVQVEQREDMFLQLGGTKVWIVAPKNISPEEAERRDDAIHEAIADILRTLPQEKLDELQRMEY